MKKLILILMLALIPLSLRAGLEEANNFYRASRFDMALQEYLQVLKTDRQTSPYLYYNIGNCYFKLERYGSAVLFYKKAFSLAPRDNDIRKNLSLALSMTGQSLISPGVPEVLHRAVYFFSSAELKGLTIVFLWAFSLTFAFWLFKRKMLALNIILFALFVTFGAWYFVSARALKDTAVTVAASAELRSGPGVNFPTSATAAEGYSLHILDKKDNWVNVKVKDGAEEGWVDENSIVNLEDI